MSTDCWLGKNNAKDKSRDWFNRLFNYKITDKQWCKGTCIQLQTNIIDQPCWVHRIKRSCHSIHIWCLSPSKIYKHFWSSAYIKAIYSISQKSKLHTIPPTQIFKIYITLWRKFVSFFMRTLFSYLSCDRLKSSF